MSQQEKIEQLQERVSELEAFCGVLLPLFEKEYKKGGWDFSEPKPRK